MQKAERLVFLTLSQRFLQDVVFGLEFGNEIAALEVLAKLLRSKNKKNRRQVSWQRLRSGQLKVTFA